MSRTRRRLATVITRVGVVAWVVFYAVALASADQQPGPVTALAQLVVPPLLWVALLQIGSAAGLAVRHVLRRSWSWAGSGMSATDPPGRLLAVAVATLPEPRREWGVAMPPSWPRSGDGRPAGGSRSAAPGPRCGCHRQAVGRCSRS